MKHNPIIKALTLILVFCIADVYVLADTKKTTSAKDMSTNAPSKMIVGSLYVPYHHWILVNERAAGAGDTIVSGSRLQASVLTTAMVNIASVGVLHIERNTDLMLMFDQRSVDVKVSHGNVTLSTSDGVKGQVTMPDGEVCASMPTVEDGDRGPTASKRTSSLGWDAALFAIAGVGAALLINAATGDGDCLVVIIIIIETSPVQTHVVQSKVRCGSFIDLPDGTTKQVNLGSVYTVKIPL